MKISLFEYRRRKAEAAMKKAEAQQQVLDFLLAAGYQRRFAEQTAEDGQDFRAPGDLTAAEFEAVNGLLAEVRAHEAAGYLVEQETTIL